MIEPNHSDPDQHSTMIRIIFVIMIRLTWWKLYSVAAKERKVEAWLWTIDNTWGEHRDHLKSFWSSWSSWSSCSWQECHLCHSSPVTRGGAPCGPRARPRAAQRSALPTPICQKRLDHWSFTIGVVSITCSLLNMFKRCHVAGIHSLNHHVPSS